MTNEIKELLDAAILNDQNCIYIAAERRRPPILIGG